jgi:hypothetical protein
MYILPVKITFEKGGGVFNVSGKTYLYQFRNE